MAGGKKTKTLKCHREKILFPSREEEELISHSICIFFKFRSKFYLPEREREKRRRRENLSLTALKLASRELRKIPNKVVWIRVVNLLLQNYSIFTPSTLWSLVMSSFGCPQNLLHDTGTNVFFGNREYFEDEERRKRALRTGTTFLPSPFAVILCGV